MALVSVILPTYNRPKMLYRALRSIEAQTYGDFEAIVVNDGGEDVRDVVAQFPFARYIAHRRNRGLPAARNTGIRIAAGKYIAYLDDDDVYYSNHLKTMVDLLDGSTWRFAYTDCHFWYDNKVFQIGMSVDYSRERLREYNITPVICVMHERSLIDEAGYFDETLHNHEDYEMWLRMSDIIDFYHFPVVTCAYSIRLRDKDQMSANEEAMRAGLLMVQRRYAQRMRELHLA